MQVTIHRLSNSKNATERPQIWHSLLLWSIGRVKRGKQEAQARRVLRSEKESNGSARTRRWCHLSRWWWHEALQVWMLICKSTLRLALRLVWIEIGGASFVVDAFFTYSMRSLNLYHSSLKRISPLIFSLLKKLSIHLVSDRKRNEHVLFERQRDDSRSEGMNWFQRWSIAVL